MTCADARDLMLEAEPAELRGEGAGALALHLAACADCAARAHAVLGATGALDLAVARIAGRPARTAAVARRRARPGRFAPLGLAAAAALALLVLWRGPGDAPPPTGAAATVHGLRGVEVDLAVSGRSAAVFETADPTITVVWFF